MCVVRPMIGAQVYRVVRWLFGCGLAGLLLVLIVPLFLLILAMPGLCCFLRLTHEQSLLPCEHKRHNAQARVMQVPVAMLT